MRPADDQRKAEKRESEHKHSASPGKGRNVAHPEQGARENEIEPGAGKAEGRVPRD
jgi:hypothetical protein